MVNTSKLRGVIAERGKTYEDVAKHLGITPKTFGIRMKSGIFKSNEMDILTEYLDIKEPAEIFFAKDVTHDATNLNNLHS